MQDDDRNARRDIAEEILPPATCQQGGEAWWKAEHDDDGNTMAVASGLPKRHQSNVSTCRSIGSSVGAARAKAPQASLNADGPQHINVVPE
jgi:hypothetical protein